MPEISVFLKFGEEDVFSSTTKPQQATISMTEGKHDLFQVATMQGDSHRLLSATSAPAIIDIVANGFHQTFRGYLDTPAPERRMQQADNTLSVLGVSSIMRSGYSRAWTNRKPSYIVEQIIERYRLGLEMDRYEEPIEFISQSEGESDWQTLNRVADKIGFSLVVDGPVLRMVDVDVELTRARDIGYESFSLPTARNRSTNVSLFKLMSSTTPNDNSYRNWKMAGVDKLRQRFEYEVIFDRGYADFEPEFDGVHAGSFVTMRQAMIEARSVRRRARWTQIAKMSCLGYRDVKPGRYVYVLDNEGEMGGFWYVTDVRHEIHNQRNISSSVISMCRSSRTLMPSRVAVKPARPPQLVLRSDQWQCDRHWRKVA